MKYRGVVLFAAVFLLPFIISAQNSMSLLPEETLRDLVNEVSGDLALESIRQIARFRRDQGSDEYHHAAEWVAEEAKRAGLDDVHIESYPADGRAAYYMYRSRAAWEIDSAELWIVEPESEKLTSYHEIPVSVARYSHACDATAALVDVGEGTSPEDYEGVDVKGKIVLAHGSAGSVADIAVGRFGALGVVTINMRYADDEPDNVSRLALESVQTPTFAFGLSHRRGEALRARLAGGENIVVRAVVDARVHPGNYENVVATIEGTDLADEEILFTAHLCHYKPGANDNLLGVPSAFFLVWPDRYYHTSGDTPDKCDPTQLKRSSFIGAAPAAYLMDDSPDKARRLAGEVFARVVSRMAFEAKRGYGLINQASGDESLHEAYKEAVNIVEQSARLETATLAGVKDYSRRGAAIDEYVDRLTAKLAGRKEESLKELRELYEMACRDAGVPPREIALTAEEIEASKTVPERDPDLKGPIGSGYLEERLQGSSADLGLPIFRADSRIRYEILNFIDGRNTVLDIRNAVSAEYEPIPVQWVTDYINLLKEASIVK